MPSAKLSLHGCRMSFLGNGSKELTVNNIVYDTENMQKLIVHLIKRSEVGSMSQWTELMTLKGTYVLENFVPCRTTFSTASRKSRSVATFRRARMANIPAY